MSIMEFGYRDFINSATKLVNYPDSKHSEQMIRHVSEAESVIQKSLAITGFPHSRE